MNGEVFIQCVVTNLNHVYCIQAVQEVKYTSTPSVLECAGGSRSCPVCKPDERNTGLMLHFNCQSCSDFCVRPRVPIFYGAHSASYLMDVGVTFAEDKDNVELYKNFPYSIVVCA
jgi:hypothetical protein